MAPAHPRRVKPALERIARALCSQNGLPENTMYQGRPMWEDFLPKARAALNAIRTPTEAMAEAGGAIGGFSDWYEGQYAEKASEVWKAMVEAALIELP